MTTPAATASPLDVAAVRAAYPALQDGWAYLDGAAGTQVPRAVIHAARQPVADLVGAPSRTASSWVRT